jgi:hypothetical protein
LTVLVLVNFMRRDAQPIRRPDHYGIAAVRCGFIQCGNNKEGTRGNADVSAFFGRWFLIVFGPGRAGWKRSPVSISGA